MVVPRSNYDFPLKAGFTLVEISIVLVIIGLIVGGVMVGRDLISAAAVRAQILQIEKYNAAVNTFRGKYGYLPGDMPDPAAGQFGFTARGIYAGEGDGNGIIEGIGANAAGNNGGIFESAGETLVSWHDLSDANLVDGGFSLATETNPLALGVFYPLNSLPQYLPSAKIGQGNYIYVWSGGMNGGNGINYFGISAQPKLYGASDGVNSSYGFTVAQAYNIDKKMDDGMPQSGRVTAAYLGVIGGTGIWAGASPGTAMAPSGSTCYDNGSTSSPMVYTMGQNNGSGINCALSFQFQ